MGGKLDRVAYSPGEFAALFGKQQTWGYRQIYAQKVKTITEFGRIKIPAAEVERILATAKNYDGEKKQKKSAKPPSNGELWTRFLAARRAAKGSEGKPKRSATLARLRPDPNAVESVFARVKRR